MLRSQILGPILLIFIPVIIQAETLDFLSFWKEVESHSLSQKAKQLEWKASEIGKERSERHWLPRVYTDIRSFNTNDPALNFIGKLSQRSATESDFSTASVRNRPGNFLDANNQPYTNLNSDTANLFAKDTLNYPGANTYSRGSLGLDLPLYEGGSSQAFAKIQEKRMIGLKWEKEAIRDREFAQTAKLFRGIQSLLEFKERIAHLSKIETKFQSNYQLGNKGNPLGYSGYLALKSLNNRLLAMEKEADSQIGESKAALSFFSGLKVETIQPKRYEFLDFIGKFFPDSEIKEESSMVKALKIFTEGESLKPELEKAKFLPKVGIYSEANAYSGSRSTQTAYTAGFYVQMNLYSPKEIGSVKEAELQSDALRNKLQEAKEREESQYKTLIAQENTLRENYKLLLDSYKNQEEQIVYMQRLFQSGAIQAIQFAEVLNRTADLSKSLLDAEMAYLYVKSELSIYQKGNQNEPNFSN